MEFGVENSLLVEGRAADAELLALGALLLDHSDGL